jgi:hypothetical protein
LLNQKGEILALGDAPQFDEPSYPATPFKPVPFVGLASTSTGQGLWLLNQKGEILALGDAPQFDEPSYPATPFEPIPFVGLAATSTGQGLWLLTENGEFITVGDASSFQQQTSILTIACPEGTTTDFPATFIITGTLTPAVEGSPIVVTYTPPTNPTVVHTVTTDGNGAWSDSIVVNPDQAYAIWTVDANFVGDSGRTAAEATCTFVPHLF